MITDEFLQKLLASEESIPANWSQRCLDSIRKQKEEVTKRYNIRIGQTEIYCLRCNKSITNPGKHVCDDLRLQVLQLSKREKSEGRRQEHQEISNQFLGRISEIGRTKVATLLEISVNTVSRWIDRGKVPKQYHKRLETL